MFRSCQDKASVVLLASFLIVGGGCSRQETPRLVPVQGRVLLDGKGVTAGSVHFYPGTSAEYTKDKPSSILQSDGSFNAKTFPFGEGVAPGDYTVTLAPELAQRLKKPRYGSVDSSPWKINVPKDGNRDLVLEID